MKSKQFKSARVVRTLPRKGVLLPTFLTLARWRTAQPRFCQSCRVPAAPDDGTRPSLFAPLVRVALDQPERRLHHSRTAVRRTSSTRVHRPAHAREGSSQRSPRKPR